MDSIKKEPAAGLTLRIIRRGDSPPCTVSGRQCRSCYGWENMLAAARRSRRWRAYPLCCPCTGLTVEVASAANPQKTGS